MGRPVVPRFLIAHSSVIASLHRPLRNRADTCTMNVLTYVAIALVAALAAQPWIDGADLGRG